MTDSDPWASWNGDLRALDAVIINLDASTDRRARFERDLMPHMPQLRRVCASQIPKDARLLEDANIAPSVRLRIAQKARHVEDREIDTPGACGCTYSHIRVWQDMVQRRLPLRLVLEDNVGLVLGTHAPQVRTAFEQARRNGRVLDRCTVWHLGPNNQAALTPRPPDLDSRWDVLQWAWGTHAYILTLEAAQALLAHALPIEQHVDIYIGDLCALGRLRYVSCRDVSIKRGQWHSTIGHGVPLLHDARAQNRPLHATVAMLVVLCVFAGGFLVIGLVTGRGLVPVSVSSARRRRAGTPPPPTPTAFSV